MHSIPHFTSHGYWPILKSCSLLGLQILAFVLVAVFPVKPLAVCCAVKTRFAGGAAFVRHRGSLGTLAPAAKLKFRRFSFLANNIFGLFLHLAHAHEPVKRCVVIPGVDEFDICTSDFFVGKLFGAVLVLHVVHGGFSKLFKTIGHVFRDEILSNLSLLALFSVALVLLTDFVVLNEPETGLTHKRTQVTADGSKEILMLKVHHIFHKVFHEDTYNPDLLISEEASGAFVKAVLSETVREGVLHL